METYYVAAPIRDFEADVPEFMTFIRKDTISRWHHMVAEKGYTPVGEQTISLNDNPNYGQPFYDNDEPILGSDGEPVTDHAKMVLTVTGSVTH